MRRTGHIAGAVVLLGGVFWAGRESFHGLTAFWEHWSCPIPLALILLGLAAVLAARRPSATAYITAHRASGYRPSGIEGGP